MLVLNTALHMYRSDKIAETNQYFLSGCLTVLWYGVSMHLSYSAVHSYKPHLHNRPATPQKVPSSLWLRLADLQSTVQPR